MNTQRAPRGSVSIYPDRGYLRLRWRFEGKQHILPLKLADTKVNRQVAERKARQIELDIAAGHFDRSLVAYRPTLIDAKGLSLDNLWRGFIDFKSKTAKSKTVDKYRFTAKTLSEFFPGRAASSISVKDAERYLEWVKTKAVVPQTSKPLSADQKRRRLEEILACWTWALKTRMLTDNPWVDMPKRISVPPQPKPKPFSREEIELIIDGFQHDPHYKSYAHYVEYLLGTGCRPAEAVGLRWSNVSDDCSSVWVGETIVRGSRQPTKNN